METIHVIVDGETVSKEYKLRGGSRSIPYEVIQNPKLGSVRTIFGNHYFYRPFIKLPDGHFKVISGLV